MTYQMTIWMCRRHDDFHSAAPIVETAMQLHVTSASEKVEGLSPSHKSGGTYPPAPPPLLRRLCDIQCLSNLLLSEFTEGALTVSGWYLILSAAVSPLAVCLH